MNLLGPITDIITKVLDKVIPDPKAKAEAFLKLTELQQSGDLAVMAAQSDINKIEANNPKLFVSGWRPFIGWICGLGFGYAVFISPVFAGIMTMVGHPVVMPEVPTATILELLAGMLGFGGLRTAEKFKGVAAK
jgi:hypothetical protein